MLESDAFWEFKLSLIFAIPHLSSVQYPKMIRTFRKIDWKNDSISVFETSGVWGTLPKSSESEDFFDRKRMSISGIAATLGISKSYLYLLVATYPTEVPKSKEDIELWSAFVNRHRIEPIGDDRLTSRRVS